MYSLVTTFLQKRLNFIVGFILFGALLTSLHLTSEALRNSAQFANLYTWLLVINSLALIALLTLIILNLRQLFTAVLKRRAGSRLTFRLLGLLVALSSVPVTIVYYFSVDFLNQRLDSWFDVNIENAMHDALELTQAALDDRVKIALRQTQTVAAELMTTPKNRYVIKINALRDKLGAYEMSLLGINGQIVVFSGEETEQLLPSHPPTENTLLQLKLSHTYTSLEPIGEQGFLYIRVIQKFKLNGYLRLLHVLYPVPENMNILASKVEASYEGYKEHSYLHQPLEISFTLVLSLVLVLSFLGTVWIAFFAARRFVAPLSHLVEGTKAVAAGDYRTQLPVTRLDELGFLVESFNDMTRKISQAQSAARQSQLLADSQRNYLQTILGRLSSGVISLDHKQRLRTANLAAEQILEADLSDFIGQHLTDLQQEHSTLQVLYEAMQPYVAKNSQEWSAEINFFGSNGRKMLMCRGAQLQVITRGIQNTGYVIVFDDITTLIQAQRNEAWSEVARRLAHEIKNPLTPIKLSAERLQHKYLRKLPESETDTLLRMTNTIINQVDAMKDMVNEFSSYARTPAMQLQRLDINELVKEILDLYPNTQVNWDLTEPLPQIEADRGRLRQVLHNIIKNAQEASPEDSPISISSEYMAEDASECVELVIQDQGTGIPTELLDRIFEPYVTTKTKGTGLGLAIVKKIIEEHHGMVWIENKGGVCVTIRLPIPASSILA
ncbi:ATP-binding protein [Candidatus Albibeggiatoa sp. nov. NOAA]|uniref:sensor histidine kinase n=1 Tax=Candidatus Albibeggiatoa sp. nov. NOAA TaxID=3162724 RepID=UPI0032FBD617|nr:ATP-binding protein [Thiotrichaceae bacterium]